MPPCEAHREITLLMTKMRRLCSMAVNKQLALVGSSMHLYMVLFRLVHDEEVPQHELAFDAAIDPAAASRLIRDMSGDGLVTTRVDPKDKRQRFVKVTPKGRLLERTLGKIVDDALAPFMGGLTAQEEELFIGLLRKAHDAVLLCTSAPTEAEEPKSGVSAATPAKPRASRLAPRASTRRQPERATSPRSRSTR